MRWTRSDVRDAVRALIAGRGSTVLAFVILTLTMTAATVTFSVVDAVGFRPLPYGVPDRLVGITYPGGAAGLFTPVSPSHYFDLVEGAQAFEGLAAARTAPPLTLEDEGTGEPLTVRSVTANLFDVLGVAPRAGRFFGPDDERQGGRLVVILSHELWVRRFGADSSIIGRSVTLSRTTREVVGVLPAGVWYPIGSGPAPDLYVPYLVTPVERSNDRVNALFVVGRLRAGLSLEQARADVVRLSSRPVAVRPLHDQVVGGARSWLLLVLAAVGAVLLVGCANVGSLLLARATVRAPEMATRLALGASSRRIAAGVFLEGVLLALACTVGALILSIWGVELAKAHLPPGLARVSTIAVDGRVAVVSVGVALLCSLVFSSAPAWMAGRTNLMSTMRAGNGAIGGTRRDRMLSVFLVADFAFVSILLTVSTLVVATFVLLTTTDLGFKRGNVAVFPYVWSLADVDNGDPRATVATLRNELLRRAVAITGVTGAALSSNTPLSGGSVRYSLVVPGFGETERDDWLETTFVSAEYFALMGISSVRGRLFNSSDRAGSSEVLIIDEVAAQRFFAGRDPVGQVVTLNGPVTIVGVVSSVRHAGPEAEARPAMYRPIDQEPSRRTSVAGSVLVRTTEDARAVAPAVHEALRPLLEARPSGVPSVTSLRPYFLDDAFRRITAGRRFNAAVMSVLGVTAVAIGAIGVYGTMSFFVARRIRMFGLQLALGATPARVMRSVVRDAVFCVGLGVAIGLAGGRAISSLLESVVFGVRPADPMVYVAVASSLTIVGVVAALGPALRAARLDPLDALRRE